MRDKTLFSLRNLKISLNFLLFLLYSSESNQDFLIYYRFHGFIFFFLGGGGGGVPVKELILCERFVRTFGSAEGQCLSNISLYVLSCCMSNV